MASNTESPVTDQKELAVDPEVLELNFHTPADEQGNPHKPGYAYWSDRQAIVRREFDWDVEDGSFRNLRWEYTLFEDGEPEDEEGDYWNEAPILGDEIEFLGISKR